MIMESLQEQVLETLRDTFWPEIQIDFHDERGDGKHFFVEVISEKFETKNRVERSQMVYASLWDFLKTDSIHALRMKCIAPSEL